MLSRRPRVVRDWICPVYFPEGLPGLQKAQDCSCPPHTPISHTPRVSFHRKHNLSNSTTCLWAFELVRFVSRSWAIQPTWEPQLSLCLETLFRSYNTGGKFIREKEKKKRKVDSSWDGMFYGNHPRGQVQPCLDLLMQIIVILTM